MKLLDYVKYIFHPNDYTQKVDKLETNILKLEMYIEILEESAGLSVEPSKSSMSKDGKIVVLGDGAVVRDTLFYGTTLIVAPGSSHNLISNCCLYSKEFLKSQHKKKGK
jgi:hypothetical protein